MKHFGYATGQFGKNHLGDRNEHLPGGCASATIVATPYRAFTSRASISRAACCTRWCSMLPMMVTPMTRSSFRPYSRD